MLALIRKRYGRAERIRVMDRGIPTEAVLAKLRQKDSKVSCLVGTPKGRLTQMEKELADKPWQQVRPHLRVKLLPRAGEVYVLAQSAARLDKERALRRRKLKALCQRLHDPITNPGGSTRGRSRSSPWTRWKWTCPACAA